MLFLRIVTQVQTAYASARRISTLLDAKEIKPDPADAEVIQDTKAPLSLTTWHYSCAPSAQPHLIQKQNLVERLLLLDQLAAVKTTHINLLLRFL